MKLFAIIGAAIIFISGVAFAHDMTYLSKVKPHNTTAVQVELPAGPSVMEVWGTNNERISCRFMTQPAMRVFYTANNTRLCIGYLKPDSPTFIYTAVTNDNDKTIDIRVWVHNSK